MESWFEVWDAENASLVGTFDTQQDALIVVRRSLDAFGAESIRTLVLTAEDSSGAEPRVVAVGVDLAELARRTDATLEPLVRAAARP